MSHLLQVDHSGFSLDGEPFQIVSGGMHYWRIVPDQWENRIAWAKHLGLNTIETYVPWNLHQPRRSARLADARSGHSPANHRPSVPGAGAGVVGELFAQVADRHSTRGGPIIAMQVENERAVLGPAPGPRTCTEYWLGWFDHWGDEHHLRDDEDAAAVSAEMLRCPA